MCMATDSGWNPFCVRMLLGAALVWSTPFAWADEPDLPAGLGPPAAVSAPSDTSSDDPSLPIGLEDSSADSSEPSLPTGLSGDQNSGEPSLPTGLDSPAPDESSASESASDTGEAPGLPEGLAGDELNQTPESEDKAPSAVEQLAEELNLFGFWELRGGVRLAHDPHQQRASLGETRLQIGTEQLLWDKVNFKLTADLLYDQALDRHGVNLETGDGFFDLREASFGFSPLDFLDVKVGRQVLTWGTGDLVFLNDLFPKDWQSFLSGRDVEYLKAPSDALKLSFFSDLVNWDVVFTPRFDGDRSISGKRISYYNPLLRRRAGRDFVQSFDTPNVWFRDSEWATRVWKNVNGVEYAGYGYWGYWKSPGGFDPTGLSATFPRLNVYGGSVRAPLWGGVANFEAAYYDSTEDRRGNNRFVNNSEMRFLVGYERQVPEITNDLTLGAQYYVEWLQDYDEYRRTLLPGFQARDEIRHLMTLRVTKLLLNQNLELSLVTFFSPSDADAYLRPRASYKIDDHWKAEIGGNVFIGSDQTTFFGQFVDNTNVYLALRYSF
jgi:hypothetical protein